MVNKKNERIWGIVLTIASVVVFFNQRPSVNSFFGLILFMAIAFGIFLIFSKDIKLRKRLNKKQKAKRSLIGGIMGLIIGFYMLFIIQTNLGLIPAILGVILLIIPRNGK